MKMSTTQTDAESKQAELRKKIEYQVACEERAHRIVERLIDNPVTQEQLINALHYITPSHYSDIVEERAVSKLCGYPLCPNDLSNVPKQKYIISTKTNKVYDIESRKNFCTARCYKASKHLECQMSSDPVWSRKNMPPTQFDLLPLDTKIGKLGDEVIVSKAGEIKEDLNRLEKLDTYQKNLAERIHEHNVEKEKVEIAKKSKNDINADEESGVKVRDEEKSVEDRENTAEDNAVVYTINKKMNEPSIGINDSDEKDRKQNDMEQFSGDTKRKNDSETCNEKVSGVKVNTVNGENAGAQERGIHNTKKSTESKSSKRNKASDPNKSKTDYLMQLLDKRKSLLAKMADIQNDKPKDDGKPRQDSRDRDTLADNARRDKDVEENKDNITELPEDEKTEIRDLSARQGEIKPTEKSYCKSVAEKQKEKALIKKNKARPGGTDASSALELICRGVQSWITLKSVEYLKVQDLDEEMPKQKTANTTFEKQYQDLVAKVDAQERDFDGLLGEEAMSSDHTDRPSAPLPHFEVLREEVEADHIRVQEFMKGSFTYKVKEKQANDKDLEGSSGVVLPTVDRYDQLLIRRKIVLDRISKVLPDVLSPLHLLIQDVFTELRELVFTFNLTSDNILFKHAEWTIVTLILLRMLSRRMVTVQKSFTGPGAEKYFTVLLSSIGASIDSVDVTVNNLLTVQKPRKVRKDSME